MITIFQVLTDYCKPKGVKPSKHDLRNIGAIVSCHFRKFWAPSLNEDIIKDAGFVKSIEFNKTYIVVGYPDVFRDEILNRIEVYFTLKCYKNESEVCGPETIIIEVKKDKPKRKRKPIKVN